MDDTAYARHSIIASHSTVTSPFRVAGYGSLLATHPGSLSHEGIFSSDNVILAVIRNPVVDPITGAIRVRLLERHGLSHGFRATCIDLTLDKPSPDVVVLPITIDQHCILIKGGVPIQEYLACCHEECDISGDGYARGLMARSRHCSHGRTHGSANFGIVKFTIDATQDRCVAVLSQFSGVEWDTIGLPFKNSPPENDSVLLDGVRERLCYVTNKDADDQVIVVVNIE